MECKALTPLEYWQQLKKDVDVFTTTKKYSASNSEDQAQFDTLVATLNKAITLAITALQSWNPLVKKNNLSQLNKLMKDKKTLNAEIKGLLSRRFLAEVYLPHLLRIDHIVFSSSDLLLASFFTKTERGNLVTYWQKKSHEKANMLKKSILCYDERKVNILPILGTTKETLLKSNLMP